MWEEDPCQTFRSFRTVRKKLSREVFTDPSVDIGQTGSERRDWGTVQDQVFCGGYLKCVYLKVKAQAKDLRTIKTL